MNTTLKLYKLSKLNAHFLAVKAHFMNEVYDLKMEIENLKENAREEILS